MKERKSHSTHVVTLNLKGLHARASARVAEICEFSSPEAASLVEIGYCCPVGSPYREPELYSNAESIMGLLMIGEGGGHVFHIRSFGAAPIVVNRFLMQLFSRGLEEDISLTQIGRIFDDLQPPRLGAPRYKKMKMLVDQLFEDCPNHKLFVQNQDPI